MQNQFINYKTKYPYVYQAPNTDGILTHYSDPFKRKMDALKWYQQTGKKLEKMFNRQLTFTKRVFKSTAPTLLKHAI